MYSMQQGIYTFRIVLCQFTRTKEGDLCTIFFCDFFDLCIFCADNQPINLFRFPFCLLDSPSNQGFAVKVFYIFPGYALDPPLATTTASKLIVRLRMLGSMLPGFQHQANAQGLGRHVLIRWRLESVEVVLAYHTDHRE